MNSTKTASYPRWAITFALLYCLASAAVVGRYIYETPYQVQVPPLQLAPTQAPQKTSEYVYWTQQKVYICLIVPGVPILFVIVAMVRPRLGGWLYLVCGLISLCMCTMSIQQSAESHPLASLEIAAIFGVITIPMLTLGSMLLLHGFTERFSSGARSSERRFFKVSS
jgi:hypothetical protein